MQRAAITPAQKRCTVVDLLRHAVRSECRSRIRQRGKPASESRALRCCMQTEKVRCAITEAVARVVSKMDKNRGASIAVPKNEPAHPRVHRRKYHGNI